MAMDEKKSFLVQAERDLIREARQALSCLASHPSIMQKRRVALERLEFGFPSKSCEFWHYTDPGRFLLSIPSQEDAISPIPGDPVFQDSDVFSVLNGVAQGRLPLVEGLSVVPVSQKLKDGRFPEFFESYSEDDFLRALNMTFVTDGFCVHAVDGLKRDRFLEFHNIHFGGQGHVRFCMSAGKETRTHVVERQCAREGAFVSSVSDVFLDEGSRMDWFLLNESSSDSSCLSALNAHVLKNAHLSVFILNTGGHFIREEIQVRLAGEGARFSLVCINLLSGKGHCDLSLRLDHDAPNTQSGQSVRNVVREKARGVFQGRIHVDACAQKTHAKMACKTLLLSDDAAFSTKPELEIFADDVVCSHGATISDIDVNHLFYLMARGIEEKTARQILVRAFVEDILSDVENTPLKEVLFSHAHSWLEASA